MPLLILAFVVALFGSTLLAAESNQPVRIAIIGLTHDHAFGFIPRLKDRADVQLAGVVETNRGLIDAYATGVQLDTNLCFNSLAELLRSTTVDAVAVFTSTFEHKAVVEACTAAGIRTLMLEKPLAVNLDHARAIANTLGRANAELIVNYETTWYAANDAARKFAAQRRFGPIRKIVAQHGHPGPKEIGCTEDFVGWLADPKLNGGGALTDMGCYGAALISWLMNGEKPESVFAVAQNFKPEAYPKVEDEVTIVLTYPKSQGIIQASWNWPYNRKDLEIYGESGYALVPGGTTVRARVGSGSEKELPVPALAGAVADPVSYLSAVARREIKPSGMSSLELNLLVTEILDAARRSIQEGRRIDMAPTNVTPSVRPGAG